MSEVLASGKMHPGYRPCVGVMVLNGEGKVWVGRRTGAKAKKDPKGPGLWWQMPQGGIDKGEDPATAAFRELNEENRNSFRKGQDYCGSAKLVPLRSPP